MLKVFNDSKTFVDMKIQNSPKSDFDDKMEHVWDENPNTTHMENLEKTSKNKILNLKNGLPPIGL